MDCSLPGSSFYEILQTRILEWIAIPFSKGSSDSGTEPGSPALQADSLPSEPPGKQSEVKGKETGGTRCEQGGRTDPSNDALLGSATSKRS